MKKEQAFELMNAIPPDLVEEADIQAPARRPLPKAVRAGLIAACLCLAFVGTAFAANPEAVAALIDRLSVHLVSTGEFSGYSLEGEMVKYPLSEFSPALSAASEGREGPATPVSLNFDTWEEVQAFLGEDIPCVWPTEWDTDHFQVILFHTELEKLWGIQICSVDLGRQAEVNVHIYTEHWTDRGGSIAGLYDHSEYSTERLEGYDMANGSTAEVIAVTETAQTDHTPQCSACGFFMRSGILYQVETFGNIHTRDETAARLRAVLDLFP